MRHVSRKCSYDCPQKSRPILIDGQAITQTFRDGCHGDSCLGDIILEVNCMGTVIRQGRCPRVQVLYRMLLFESSFQKGSFQRSF